MREKPMPTFYTTYLSEGAETSLLIVITMLICVVEFRMLYALRLFELPFPSQISDLIHPIKDDGRCIRSRQE